MPDRPHIPYDCLSLPESASDIVADGPRRPSQVFLLGFDTYQGTVTAATEWGGPAQTFDLTPALEGSTGDAMHHALPAVRERFGDTALNAFCLVLNGGDGDERQRALRDALAAPRKQRAVGVNYRKATEERSHYVTASVAKQFDAYVHVEQTTALTPL